MAFCAKLSAKTQRKVRLPTEAEWEYACRAGTKTRFHFGDDVADLGRYAWHTGNSSEDTHHPVGLKLANPWGLYDMLGNVWEWCSDWYGNDYRGPGNAVDPTGPVSGTNRHMRGGSWRNPAQACRSANRNPYRPDSQVDVLGFRVVVEEPAGEAGPGPAGTGADVSGPGCQAAGEDSGVYRRHHLVRVIFRFRFRVIHLRTEARRGVHRDQLRRWKGKTQYLELEPDTRRHRLSQARTAVPSSRARSSVIP